MLARTTTFRAGWWRFCPPPSHVEAPLRSAQPRPWSSPVARVSPGDLRDFPWSLQHRLADARATPRLRFRRSGRIASVGQRLAGLSQEGSLSTSGGGSPQSGRVPFGAARAPFGAAGAIWRGRAPFGAAGRHSARAGRSGAICAAGRHLRGSRAGHLEASPGRKWEADLGRVDNHCPSHFKVRRCGDSPCGDSSAIRPSRIIHCGSDCPYDLELNGPRRVGGSGIASGRWLRDSIGIGDQPVSRSATPNDRELR